MKKGDLKISKNTVVRCSTYDLAQKVLTIADNLGYKRNNKESFFKCDSWVYYREFTCYDFFKGIFGRTSDYMHSECYIISAEDFLALHEPKDLFVYYLGNKKRGKEIIKALENLGGINNYMFTGSITENYYFIDYYTMNIDSCTEKPANAIYKEVFLPPVETIEIGGVKYDKNDLENALKNLKPVE